MDRETRLIFDNRLRDAEVMLRDARYYRNMGNLDNCIANLDEVIIDATKARDLVRKEQERGETNERE